MSRGDVSIGIQHTVVSDLREAVKDSKLSSDFIVIPLFHPRFRRNNNICREGPSTRSDRELDCQQWVSLTIGNISEWISSSIELNNLNFLSAEKAFRQEVSWATHLCLQVIILPTPMLYAPNYSKVVSQICSSGYSQQQMWIRIPFVIPFTHTYKNVNIDQINDSCVKTCLHNDDGWILWDNFRRLTGHNHRICIALELSKELLTDSNDCLLLSDSNLCRWAAEPVKAILLNCNLFVNNKAGFPVLSKQLQRVFSFFFQFKVKVILTGRPSIIISNNKNPDDPYDHYTQYLKHLRLKFNSSLSDSDRFTIAYRDTLQAPLQPLMDNLEAQTYETFEKDPIKYQKYQNAIHKALLDIIDSKMDKSEEMTITVVGAGRGPLVASALNAACLANVSVKIFAVEKNENAVITLRNRIISERWSTVTLIASDMRNWQPKPDELCDILVSELLGSFGDNELSPECLDGAQKCLKSGGISIPCDYTSFIAPVSTSRLWMGARDIFPDRKGLNTAFVVLFHQFYQFSESKPLFRFDHPSPVPIDKIDNSRFATVSFTSKTCHTLHGLSGFFETTLYGNETLSINPQTFTKDMFSWFPLFIPLATPIRVKEGDIITFAIWRCCDSRKVWYEWCLLSPEVTAVQNSNGSSYFIGL